MIMKIKEIIFNIKFYNNVVMKNRYINMYSNIFLNSLFTKPNHSVFVNNDENKIKLNNYVKFPNVKILL